MIGEYCITHGDQKKFKRRIPMHLEPQQEHHWLQKLVGEWAFEGECSMGRDQPAIKEHRNGDRAVPRRLWTIGEGSGECRMAAFANRS